MNKKASQGFTLIEIAIVLVIIGLLLGGVLKGQELITSARVRNLISQQDGIKAAFFGFQDRYRALPGDYANASANIKCPATCLNGDGNGQISATGAGGTGATTHEDLLVWTHLTSAGFLNGAYNMVAADTASSDTNTPKNPYSVYLSLSYDSTWGVTGNTISKHNLKTGAQIPIEILAEVDRKVDDGQPFGGAFQFSIYAGNAAAAPTVATCSYGQGTTTAGTGIATDVWAVTGGQTNCGASSLF
jgi:prepilin-type N-terminal cleavage/methylation domain-containing protein